MTSIHAFVPSLTLNHHSAFTKRTVAHSSINPIVKILNKPAKRSRSLVPQINCQSSSTSSENDPASPSTSTDTTEARHNTSLTWGTGSVNVSSTDKPLVEIIPEACRKSSRYFQMNKLPISLIIIFIPSTFENTMKDSMDKVIPTIKRTFAMLNLYTPDTLIYGCTTSNEDLTVSILHLPKSELNITNFESPESFSIDWKQQQWHDLLKVTPSSNQDKNLVMIIFYHPDFADGMRDLLQALDFAYPSIRKVGAQIGQISPLHKSYIFSNTQEISSGASVLCMQLHEDIQLDISVAQGIRNIGPIMEVVELKQNGMEICKVKELNTSMETQGAPMTLLDMWTQTEVISLEDSRLASKYILLGTQVKESISLTDLKKESSEEDNKTEITMISRKVIGFNEATKSILIDVGDRPIRLGMKIQFQIRDEEGARKELMNMFDKLILESSSKAMEGFSIRGGILMADVERGEFLHGKVNKGLDRDMYQERLAYGIPLAAHTSAGQVGPLPSGGLMGSQVGESYMLSASALYMSFYGRNPSDDDEPENGEEGRSQDPNVL